MSEIRRRLDQKHPASFVRFGDGEGMVLACPEPREQPLWSHVQQHLGPAVSYAYVVDLAHRLNDAIENADIIGVRDDICKVTFPEENYDLEADGFLAAFRSSFHLRPGDQRLPYRHAYRLAQIHRHLSNRSFPASQLYTSAWCHYYLSASNALIKLLEGQKTIGLISCHTELREKLSAGLEARVCYYKPPPMYRDFDDTYEKASYPIERFAELCTEIEVETRGMPFLVGAGIWGKVYCSTIKQLGGIALDIGSVCDSWLGKATRKQVLKTIFDAPAGVVPTRLLLDTQLLEVYQNG